MRASHAVLAVLMLLGRTAHALDKQGSAHGGKIEGPASGFSVTGNAGLGVAVFNPSYPARPDNTGRALLRAVGHVDVDLIGRRLSIPVDFNFFTDRRATPGARTLAPSEIDIITGVTSTWRLGPGAIEGGVRVEHDRSLDGGGYPHGGATGNFQTYVDTRARYLMSLAAISPGAAESLWDGDLSGWLTLGWFIYNGGYFARPDNTGLALFRYAIHSELSVWKRQVALAFDATFLTDRRTANVIRPSEVDLTADLIFRPKPFEFHIAYERDMPVDRGGLVQHFVYVLAVVSFDIVAPREESVEPATVP